MREYTVYRLENIVTKKNYIGMTSLKPKERWCKRYTGKMKEAIDSFPLDLCWKKHIEFQTPNKEQALELESELMKYYDSVENGYNSSSYGNSHFKHSEGTNKKIRENNPSKPVLQYSKIGEFIAEYPSTRDAERKTGYNHSNICACCRGKLKSTGGFIWRYKEGI